MKLVLRKKSALNEAGIAVPHKEAAEDFAKHGPLGEPDYDMSVLIGDTPEPHHHSDV